MIVYVSRQRLCTVAVEVSDEWEEHDILEAAYRGEFHAEFDRESEDIEYEMFNDD